MQDQCSFLQFWDSFHPLIYPLHILFPYQLSSGDSCIASRYQIQLSFTIHPVYDDSSDLSGTRNRDRSRDTKVDYLLIDEKLYSMLILHNQAVSSTFLAHSHTKQQGNPLLLYCNAQLSHLTPGYTVWYIAFLFQPRSRLP